MNLKVEIKNLGFYLVITLMFTGSACEPAPPEDTGKAAPNPAVTSTGDKSAESSRTASEGATGKGRCQHFSDTGIALFGDLHVHTALSLDAYQQDVRTMPADAYAFAQGEIIPFHDSSIQIDRPLDFAAVTDHAEYLGDLEKCRHPEVHGQRDLACERALKGTGAAHQLLQKTFNESQGASRVERVNHALEVLFRSEDPVPNTELCGVNGELWRGYAQSAWQRSSTSTRDRSLKRMALSPWAYFCAGTTETSPAA